MLLNINNNLKDIKETDILYNLYYNLAELPDKKDSKKFNARKSNRTS